MKNTRARRPERSHLEAVKKRLNKRIKNKEQHLADEIYQFFGKKIEFRALMGIIRNKGYQAVYEMFNEAKQSRAKNRLALFLWRVKQEKVKWNANSNR